MEQKKLIAVRMAHPLYGCIDSSVMIKEYPVAASQYFYHAGESFVYLASGLVTKAITNTASFMGHAIVPVGRGAGASDAYWLSSATASADRLPIIVDINARYLLPGIIPCTVAMIGGAWDIIAVNDGTLTHVDLDTSTTDVVVAVALGTEYGGGANDVVVKINPAKFQATT